MRLSVVRWTVGISLLLTSTFAAADQLALDVTSDTQVFSPGVFHNVGWQFQVNGPVIVDALGIFDVNPAGLSENHQVGIWDNNGILLTQTSVTNASTLVPSASGAGNWLFQDVAPIVLAPGTYVIGGFYATSADSVMANTTITTIPQINFLHSRASTEASFAEPGVYGLVEPGVFGPDFEIESQAPVPEPASLFLLGSGLSMVALGFRRKVSLKSSPKSAYL